MAQRCHRRCLLFAQPGDLALGLLFLAPQPVAQIRCALLCPGRALVYHRERVRDAVRERLFNPELSVESVAAAVKLSVRYLQRLFEDEPLTLSAWIWHERLDAARRALLSPTNKNLLLTEIAYTVGSKDPAHVSRMFKATYGINPRAFNVEMANRSA